VCPDGSEADPPDNRKVIERDGVFCNMDFAPDTVAVVGKITKLNRTRAGNTYTMREP